MFSLKGHTLLSKGLPLLYLAALFAGLQACSDPMKGEGPASAPKGLVEARFRALSPALSTKGAVSGDADLVRSLDLVVFRSVDGLLEGHERISDEGGVDEVGMTLTAQRSMDWFLLANAPESLLSGLSTESEFLSRVTTLLHLTASTVVMHAEGTQVFSESTGVINATLVRYACKVSVRGVSVRYLDAFATAPSCTLETVALVNVRGETPLSGSPSADALGLWYNRSEIQASLGAFLQECLVQSPSLEITSSEKAVLTTDLYCMPNPSSVSDTGAVLPWAPRSTRVALGLRIGGELQWYPVELPSMQCNMHYVIDEVVILGPGTVAPDMGVDRTSIEYGILINDWSAESHDVGFGT